MENSLPATEKGSAGGQKHGAGAPLSLEWCWMAHLFGKVFGTQPQGTCVTARTSCVQEMPSGRSLLTLGPFSLLNQQGQPMSPSGSLLLSSPSRPHPGHLVPRQAFGSRTNAGERGHAESALGPDPLPFTNHVHTSPALLFTNVHRSSETLFFHSRFHVSDLGRGSELMTEVRGHSLVEAFFLS